MQPKRSINWQRALFIPLTVLAWLAVLVVVLWLLGHIPRTIITIVLSGIVAFALTPLVSLFQHWMPRFLAITLAYIVGFGVILGFGALIVFEAATQVTNLVHQLPQYANQGNSLEPRIVSLLSPFGLTKAQYHTTQQQIISYAQSVGTSTAKDSLDIVTSVLSTIVDIVLVLILSVYLTSNGPRLGAWMRSATPGAQRMQTNLIIAIVNQVIGGYVRGTLALSALVGALVGVGMLALQVPYAVLLGVIAFFMEFVPIIGVLVSGSICVTLALLQGGVAKAVIVLGYFVIVHVIEGDVVGPRIMGRAVGIHPATAIIALVAGSELFGIWGTLFGAPLAGLLQAFATAAFQQFRGGDPASVLRAVAEKADADAQEHVESERDKLAASIPETH